jgi:UDP-GlcNAc:undecaprenyl-phosphate GlcNAc-1-phosphate transferase
MRDLALHCINAFLLSIVLISLMVRFSPLVGLVDSPSGRKQHNGHIPLVGSALFVAFAIAVVLIGEKPGGAGSFLAGLTLLVITGVLDDLYDLRASFKMIAQVVCAALMILPNQVLIWRLDVFLGNDSILPQWAVPITLLAVVGSINAVNMLDGIDGLAGSLSVVALFWFAVAAGILGLKGDFSLSLLGAFCVLGFLGFNLRHRWRDHAAVFLGDAGSMMLGAIIAFLGISLSQHSGGQSLSPIAVLWVCSIPIIDTLSLIVRRLASGRSPFAADRQHLHHLMLDAGLNVCQVVSALSASSLLLGGIGVAGWYWGVPDAILLLGLLGPAGLHSWFVMRGGKLSGWAWRSAAFTKKSAVTQPSLK